MKPEIKKLSAQDLDDFIELVQVFEDAFELENSVRPGREHLQRLLGHPGFFVFTIKIQQQVIGGLTAYVLDQYYSEKPLAYIYDFAIKNTFQRQGMGKLLMAAFTGYCRKDGFEEAYVQADQKDDQAVRFYRSTAINNEIQTIQFSYLFQ